MALFEIKHITRYQYDIPVTESVNEIKLYPFPCETQEILGQEIDITPTAPLTTYQDYWGNKTGSFNLLAPHLLLEIKSRLKVRTQATDIPGQQLSASLSDIKQMVNNNLHLIELSEPSHIKQSGLLQGIVDDILSRSQSVYQIVSDAAFYVYQNFHYLKGITTIETTLDEIIRKKGGVCQDFAHLLLQLLRMAGIPCRYVSGYICSNNGQMRGEGATHAWVEALIPGFGWAGIDPANNIWVTDSHVKLAIGRYFKDCTPAKGIFRGEANQSLSVYVSIGFEDGSFLEKTSDVKLYEEAGVTIPETITPPEEKEDKDKPGQTQKQQ